MSMDMPVGSKEYRLLIVDDNRAIHEDYAKVLQMKNESSELDSLEAELFADDDGDDDETEFPTFQLDSAYQGEDAFEMVKSSRSEHKPYAMAFVDMVMPPGWDGLETIEHIWEIDPDLQIVICSAYSDHSWSEIAKRLGNSSQILILKKPFDSMEIIQMAYTMSEKCMLQRVENGSM